MTAKQVGLTGNIGSGKTTAARLFETIGIPVYYADEHAKRFLNARDVIRKIKLTFGDDCIGKDGFPDKKILAQKVFSDKNRLQKLNAMIHPLVGEDFIRWTGKHSHQAYVIMEAAILFETEHAKRFYKNILVKAPEKLRIRRVCERDGVSPEDVLKRMQHQMPETDMVPLADFVINNDGKEPLIPQIEKIHQLIADTIQ